METFTLVLPEGEFRRIGREVLASPDREIGRCLVGRLIGNHFLCPFTIPAGTNARRSAVEFTPDEDYQQVILDYLVHRFQGAPGSGIGSLKYIGDCHSHPGALDTPSIVDLQAAISIVTDESWTTPKAAFPILTVQNGRVHMRSYLMTRESRAFSEMAIEIVPDNDSRIQALLLGEVPILNQLKEEVKHEVPAPDRRRRGSFFRRPRWLRRRRASTVG